MNKVKERASKMMLHSSLYKSDKIPDEEKYVSQKTILTWLEISATTLKKWTRRDDDPIPHMTDEQSGVTLYPVRLVAQWLNSKLDYNAVILR